LITRASRSFARSPCSAAPFIRFLFIGSQFRSTLPLHGPPSAVALHFARCDQLATGLAHARVHPCWAHKQNGPQMRSVRLLFRGEDGSRTRLRRLCGPFRLLRIKG
jgi:hypothetical protein